MATPYNGFDLPVVGADADAWGGKLNTILTSIDTLLSSPANTIRGNNGGSQVATEDLTPTEVTAMLNPVVGAGVSPGTKGLLPAPTVAQKRLVMTGAGTYERGPGRRAGCVITTTNVSGSQPTLSGVWNVASISTLTVVGTTVRATLTFTDALPDAFYCVHVSKTVAVLGGATADSGYRNKTTTTVDIEWDNTGGVATELSVSIF